MIWMTAMLAQATEAAQQGSIAAHDIVVTAPGQPFRIEVEQLRRGEAAFAKDHARYAPRSTLHFRLTARGGTLDDFALSATDGRTSIPVPLSTEGDILLPDLPSGEWTLIGNRSRSGVRLGALVISPGTTATDIRLGDLRLQCRVGWAVIRSRYSVFVRGAFDAAGGCGSSRFAIYEGTGRPIATAQVGEQGRSAPLPIGFKGMQYRMPIADRTLSDEARVRIVFR